METSGSCSFPSVPSRTDAENVDGQGHTSTLNSIEEDVSKNVLHGEDDVDITEPPHKKVKSVLDNAPTKGGRVLDPFRSSLSPRMVEALVCTQDWLRKGRGPLLVEEIIEDLERIEEETALKVISHPCQSSMIMHNTPSSRLLNE